MRAHVDGIDHVVILVRDLDLAEETYSRLGFSLSPRGYHSLGSQNHCLMFQRDYVELLAVPKPHPVMQSFMDFLAVGEGVGAIALATKDANGLAGSLNKSGIQAEAPVDFSRPVELPGGTREAKFRIVQLPAQATPGCRMFACQHFNRDVVWRPDYLTHPVGVTGLAAVGVVAADAAPVVAAYEKVLDEKSSKITEGRLVKTGSAPIAISGPAGLRKRLAGVNLPSRAPASVAALFLHVQDRGRAASALRLGGFEPIRLADGSLAVGADQAHGVALIFG